MLPSLMFVSDDSMYRSLLQSNMQCKIRVAYNNVFRKFRKLPPRSSASLMFATNDVYNFESLIRSKVYSFIKRLETSNNSVIQALSNNYISRYIVWKKWHNILYVM